VVCKPTKKGSGERSRYADYRCDYHPGFQQIAFVDTETGDYGEQRLGHSEGAEQFPLTQGKKVRVGMEASGHARWFERLLVGQFSPVELVRNQNHPRL
jgi:hypothetical protein